jgi:hypothetical protein
MELFRKKSKAKIPISTIQAEKKLMFFCFVAGVTGGE